MHNIEKHFDHLVALSRKSVSEWNYLLVYGYFTMSISILVQYFFQSRAAIALGIGGVFFGYIGVALSILAYKKEDKSRIAKVILIICFPILIIFAVMLYK